MGGRVRFHASQEANTQCYHVCREHGVGRWLGIYEHKTPQTPLTDGSDARTCILRVTGWPPNRDAPAHAQIVLNKQIYYDKKTGRHAVMTKTIHAVDCESRKLRANARNYHHVKETISGHRLSTIPSTSRRDIVLSIPPHWHSHATIDRLFDVYSM